MLDHGAAWQEVAVELVNAGFRVIAPDLRGHGLSDHESPASSYHMLDFVADLDSILAGDTFTLVGHSFGAVIASLFSLARPERVQSLVLVEPPSLLRAQQRKRLDGLTAQLDQFASPAAHPVFPDLSDVAVRLQRSVPGISAEHADRHARRLTRLCEGGFTWRWDPRLRARFISGLDSLPSETYSDISERFAGRVSFVYGSSGITADGREEMNGAANRRVTITGGHNLHLESPSAVAATVIESCRTAKATVASPGRRF
jgi:pimeloyl-ACP methyl ester carboxylesterase